MCKFLSIYVIAYSLITLYFTWRTEPIASRLRHVMYFVYSFLTWRYVISQKTPLHSCTIASHRPVGVKTHQWQVHVAPVQLFGAKNNFYQHLRRITGFLLWGFKPNIWPGPRPSNGHSHSLSWTSSVTPFVQLSGWHRYHGRKLKFQTFKVFRLGFQRPSLGRSKRLNWFSNVSTTFQDAFFKVEPKGLTTGPKFMCDYGQVEVLGRSVFYAYSC